MNVEDLKRWVEVVARRHLGERIRVDLEETPERCTLSIHVLWPSVGGVYRFGGKTLAGALDAFVAGFEAEFGEIRTPLNESFPWRRTSAGPHPRLT